MADVVMRKEDSDNTLSVKELDAFLPQYKPQVHVDFNPPLLSHLPSGGSMDFEDVDRWIPMLIRLPPTPQDELERIAKKFLDDILPGFVAAVPQLDEPLPVNGFRSPDMLDFVPPSDIGYMRNTSPPFTSCPPYSPTAPGHLDLDYSRSENAQPRLFAKIGLHCYNLEKGTNFEHLGLPRVAEHTDLFTLEAKDPVRNYTCKFETRVRHALENKDCLHVITTCCRTLPPPPLEEDKDGFQCGFDTLSVDELFRGNMPDWLPDDTSKLLQYYEMKESEVEQAKEWLHMYVELAWYTKKQTDPFLFMYTKPLDLEKVIVQTRGGPVDPMKKVKMLDNAVFFISFKTSCGDVYKGIIRRTSDGNPEHLSLEARCFM